MDRRRCLAIPLIAALPLLAASAARAAVADERWSDSARARSLPLRIRWPDGNAACALVLHSHGLGGSRDGGDAWGRAWREAGFAVVHVQHPGSDSEVLRGGLLALRAAASADPLIARVADMRFVLGEILRRAGTGDGPWLRVRADAIGASGHSFGAQTVQALAGKRYRVATDGFADARLQAFIAFSPSLGKDGMSAEAQFAAVTRPFLAVTGFHDGDAEAQAALRAPTGLARGDRWTMD